jgi:hypothetical protein
MVANVSKRFLSKTTGRMYKCKCGHKVLLPLGLPPTRVRCHECIMPIAKLVALIGILPIDLLHMVLTEIQHFSINRPLNIKHIYPRCHVCRQRKLSVRLRPAIRNKKFFLHAAMRTHACDECIAAGAILVPRGWGPKRIGYYD